MTPALFISLGTIFTDHPEFYRTYIEAFGDGSWQIAMTVGEVRRVQARLAAWCRVGGCTLIG